MNGIHEEVRCRKPENCSQQENGIHEKTSIKENNEKSDNVDKELPGDRNWTKNSKWWLLGILFVFTLLFLYINRVPPVKEFRPPKLRSKELKFGSAAVASDALICSTIGKDILEKKNGSAVDSAIATLLCMSLVNMHSLGIGGGFISTIYDSKTKEVYVLDAREVAPRLAREDMFVKDPNAAITGPLAIGVPGELRGYWAMHQRFGRLPWADLFQPAIELCENGFPVYRALARAREKIVEDGRENEEVMKMLTNETTGEPIRKGDVLKHPKLAKTLRSIALEGAHSFYTGSVAKLIIEDLRDAGSIITPDDLKSYGVRWRKPAHVTLKDGLTVYSAPSPGGGPAMLLALNILDGFDFDNTSLSSLNRTVQTYHRWIEALKFAYSLRPNLADPDFVDISKVEGAMISKELAERFRNFISDERTYDTEYYGNTPYNEVKPGTAHLSLIDAEGNAVAVTSTLNQYTGSTILGERTGVLFNCGMDDFSIPGIANRFEVKPEAVNYIRPGKRSLSCMAPTIILKGDKSVKMVIGAAGGTRIPSTIAQVILKVLRLGQNLTSATDGPRLHHQLLPHTVYVEKRYPSDVIKGLEAKGHLITSAPTRGSVVQTVLVEDGEVIAISDDRKGGKADGY